VAQTAITLTSGSNIQYSSNSLW